MKMSNKLVLHAAIASFFALVLALSFTSGAYAGTDWQTPCVANGGSWSGPNGFTGTCTYFAGNIIADSNCGGSDDYEEYFNSGNPTGSACVPAATIPGTPEADCNAAGGSWSGADSDNGDCAYAAGSSAAVFACGAGYEYTETYVAGIFSSYQCSVATSDSDDDTSGSDDGEVTGEGTQPVTLVLGGGDNGSATFSPDACPQKCTIGPSLPAAAKDGVPSDALATMYVRVVDQGGAPGTGTYTVCFKNPNNDPVTVYRFVSGVWVAVAANSGNPICTTASGDGAFYLGN